MNKFTQFLEEKFMPVAAKVGEQRHLQAIRDGIILTTPLTIIGSLFLILAYLPIPGYDAFMANTFGAAWRDNLTFPVGVTFDLLAVFVAIGVAYRLAERYKIDPISAAAMSLAGFMLVTPYKISFTPEGINKTFDVTGIPLALTGSKGMFVAILVAIISTEIFRFSVKKNFVIRMPDGVPPAVSKSFASLIPGFLVIITLWVLRLILQVTPFGNLHNVVGVILGKPLSLLGGSLAGAIIAVIIAQLLWVTGIHGQALVWGIMGPVWLTLVDQNRLAFTAGQPIPNVVTQQFMDIFYSIGGSGVTLGLAILLLTRSKSKQLKQIGKLAIAPGLFNINEPITFGLPMIMNPIMMIPFVLVPVVIVSITYFAMATGLVAKTAGIMVPWTTPAIISGFLATGGKISGAVMQIVSIIVSAALYYPFFRIYDNQKFKEENSLSDIREAGITK
ncbi:PTS cellobiose transporter subunit IIC [Fonticella tunisiensis]|uniref:Permease IIC component n=1 Tax=Fonticella tunisiensis TaxID=1096341 RepID=A0A4R7KUX5_9CLOT|nr:PTS cellobiose transporter subunit IIC [Fonticella tunisiensis]TDT62307.1 PTS system lichenan oligosaccharide-specific IIC component (Lac family) [Fonticella tunisiensis]